MTVIIAENTPDRIRGILKRWFLEPKPNVFVGNVNAKVCETVIRYLRRQSAEWNAIIFVNSNVMQGYKVFQIGKTSYKPIRMCGLDLIATKTSETFEECL